MNFKCIIVLYNVNYKDSASYTDLVQTECYKQGKMEIICVDNSVQPMGNDELKFVPNHFYIDMHGNKGLSKAYNAAIERICQREVLQEDLIVLLDDDTHIGDDYFEKMSIAGRSGSDVYLPIVQDQKGIMSPNIMKRFRCSRCTDVTQINMKNISGINSGMAIRSTVFCQYHYNEELFLDYIDHSFIRDMKEQGKKIEIVDTILQQNFSTLTDNYDQSKKRFEIFRKDIKVFYSRDFIDKLAFVYIVSRRKLGIFLKFKRIFH